MFLDGFSLEVLVNSSTLQEYREPVYNYKSSTGSSYVHLSKKFERINNSPDNIYVAVPEIGSRFSLRFGATIATLANPIVVEIFVDGNHDFTYDCLVAPAQAERDGFWNATRDKKAYFKFSKTLWTNDEIDKINSSNSIDNNYTNNLPRKGGIGAITLFFYLARRTRIKNEAPFKFTLEKVAITESKENKGIEFSTEFEERSESPPPDIKDGKCTMKPVDNSPIAVLNIHYRPMNWLIARGIIEPGIYPNIFTDNVDFKDFRPLPSIKKDDTVNDVKLEDDVVFVTNSNNLTVPNKKVKQKYQETIVILDSDDE
ncbi:14139_t:CDS:2, partial [Ambispora leptoticha]